MFQCLILYINIVTANERTFEVPLFDIFCFVSVEHHLENAKLKKPWMTLFFEWEHTTADQGLSRNLLLEERFGLINNQSEGSRKWRSGGSRKSGSTRLDKPVY